MANQRNQNEEKPIEDPVVPRSSKQSHRSSTSRIDPQNPLPGTPIHQAPEEQQLRQLEHSEDDLRNENEIEGALGAVPEHSVAESIHSKAFSDEDERIKEISRTFAGEDVSSIDWSKLIIEGGKLLCMGCNCEQQLHHEDCDMKDATPQFQEDFRSRVHSIPTAAGQDSSSSGPRRRRAIPDWIVESLIRNNCKYIKDGFVKCSWCVKATCLKMEQCTCNGAVGHEVPNVADSRFLNDP